MRTTMTRRRNMKILMVLTSHDQLATPPQDRLLLEEFAAPTLFSGTPASAALASPKGGQPPIDPKSDLPENQTPAMARSNRTRRAKGAFPDGHACRRESGRLRHSILCGRARPMWDLAESTDSIALIESFYNSANRWLWFAIRLVCFIESPTRARRL